MKRSFAFSSREMRQLNASLVAERDQFAQIFRAAPVGLARLELDGNVAMVNPAMASIVGLEPGDAGGTAPARLRPPPGRGLHPPDVRPSWPAGGGACSRCERRLVHKNGATVFTKFGAAGVHDERGIVQQLIVVVEDVTERNRLEIELRHSQKLESVGRLAAGIAHEINTPIQFVGDNVSFLSSAFNDLLALCKFYRGLFEEAHRPHPGPADLARRRGGRGDRRPGLPARERAPLDRRHPGRRPARRPHRAGDEELRPPRPGRKEPRRHQRRPAEHAHGGDQRAEVRGRGGDRPRRPCPRSPVS